LYVRSLVEHLPDGASVALAALKGRHAPLLDDAFSWRVMASGSFLTRYEPSYRLGPGWLGDFAAVFAVRSHLLSYLARLGNDITGFGQKNGVTSVLAILESPSAMLLAAPVARSLGVPLHTLVWDVPEQVLPRWGHSGWSARILKRGFEDAIRASTSIGVLSEPMAGYVEAVARRPTHLLRQPIEPHWGEGSAYSATEGTVFLGFAGSVTAAAEIEAVMRALDTVGWKLQGRRVVLRVYSNRFVCTADCERHVEFLGYAADTPDVVRGLAACDILLLPQPFSVRDDPFVRYSFPTKFTTYLAARRPILLIAPETSALVGYFRNNDLPAVCAELSAAEILSQVESLLDPGCVATCKDRYRVAAERDFSVSVFRRSLAALLATGDAGAISHA
jgi:hypothetical protein